MITESIKALSKRDISHMSLVYKDEYLSHLNHEQRVAATRKEGNYLVIAGPGSGKTHTLAYRVVYLVKNNIDPKSIVVITFTRKAGKELKERINRLLPNTSLGFIGTFHSFSHHISSKLGNGSPISGFRLLDPEDDVQVHKLVMANFKPFNKNIKAKKLQKILSYCYNTELSIGDYIKKYDVRDLMDDISNLEAYVVVYEKYKASHLLANYDDMIRLVSKYLDKEKSKEVTRDFEYLMIDEYQDTNKMQLDFIKGLDISNVMAIGDDFQGIYGFRGADHKIILNFINDFKNAHMIKLKENYRSTSSIIDCVNKTVERSSMGFHKKFRVVKTDPGQAEVISGKSLEDHKAFILDKIRQRANESHALIYRYNKNRNVFEKALIEENIEYSVYGGIRLLERKHIKDILAFLMVYLNRLDIVSINRILNLFPGIGPKTSRRLIDSNLEDLTYLSSPKKDLVLKLKDLLDFKGSKEVLYSKICEFYFSIFEHVSSDYYTKEEVNQDLKLIYDLLVTYENLNNFIINLILDPVVDMHKGKRPKVILSTIHSAKGLEFDHVYYFHTHDWYKNYDDEALEEARRLFYVGISRAKKNLYIIDHTTYPRAFDEIIRDFDNTNLNRHESMYYESKPKEIHDLDKPKIQENSTDKAINIEDVYECIDGEIFKAPNPSLKHQNTLMRLSSELYTYLKGKSCEAYLGPMKIKLTKKDGSEHYVQPDLFVMEAGESPLIIVEVISDETRSKDMIKKLDLYMKTGIQEYWLVDPEACMVMLYSFRDYDLNGSQVFTIRQSLESKVFGDLKINMCDILTS